MKYKNYLLIAILAIAAVFYVACEKEETDPFSGIENMNKDASYAMGMSIGADLINNMMTSYVYPDLDEFLKGINDMMKGRETRIDTENAIELIEAAFNSIAGARNDIAKQAETAFLTENAKRTGINVTSSGLQYEIIVEGTGPKPSFEDSVLVHYEGAFMDGTIFDSSIEYGQPVTLSLNDVIVGWSEGIQYMNAGSQYILYIPSALAYGESGYINPWTGDVIIPPYSALIFIVELIEINPETGEL
ncbi:MAG: FKBP-type peptidyl-prolyl cis-trans isomerase [Treponema sp.]|nr:FKBP-type peptidyl-prolyl cis-trans isomerase [Treponema sp.]